MLKIKKALGIALTCAVLLGFGGMEVEASPHSHGHAPGFHDGRHRQPPPSFHDGRHRQPPPGFHDGRHRQPPPGFHDGRHRQPPLGFRR
jgi:hypothetical protein